MEKHSIYIGTSGWLYKHWRNTFYPADLKVKEEFAYYAGKFSTVEINSTFYGVPSDQTLMNWKKNSPPHFVYTVKASRFITHLKKLHNTTQILHSFIHKMELLGSKLGVILVQLPPYLKADTKLLETFLKELPKTNRFVIEFRNAEWYTAEVFNLLKKHNVGFCIYELAGHLSPLEITADFVYLRLHGPTSDKYRGNYSGQALKKWADQCKIWLQTKDVYVYFDNDEQGYAAFNALKLEQLVNSE
ncbi:uncharacterized protein YecE (DUF72 family) [Flavobacterium sp. 2755]|uniref:DUF72 domain-containing protein n=1 Tax=Flavobacterium sp. 2755 TaxID=2817765 RepID=UPI002866F143|nr:DUF72 domain-containing protein [Flavobacterium sp. 2755]MDR6764416.1 uncharacterized protein YecE (DUF72 family) [Flavobacterium sp. 2755]